MFNIFIFLCDYFQQQVKLSNETRKETIEEMCDENPQKDCDGQTPQYYTWTNTVSDCESDYGCSSIGEQGKDDDWKTIGDTSESEATENENETFMENDVT